jgi:hypothetical protein
MKTRLLALVFAVCGTAGSFAASPLGTFTYDFNATNNPLWDLSGPLVLNQQMIGAAGAGIPFIVPITVDQNIKGRLASSGYANVLVDTNVINGRYRVEGKVYTASARTKVKLNVRTTGRDVISGVTNNFKSVLVYHLEIYPLTQMLSGTVRGNARFSALPNGRIDQDIVVPLQAGNDGSWVLKLNLTSTTPPGGNAAITLPNGRFLQYSARGSYSESKDQTKLTLRGFGNSDGSKLSLRLATTNAILTDLGGRVLGQKLNEPVEDTPPKPEEPGDDD